MKSAERAITTGRQATDCEITFYSNFGNNLVSWVSSLWKILNLHYQGKSTSWLLCTFGFLDPWEPKKGILRTAITRLYLWATACHQPPGFYFAGARARVISSLRQTRKTECRRFVRRNYFRGEPPEITPKEWNFLLLRNGFSWFSTSPAQKASNC